MTLILYSVSSIYSKSYFYYFPSAYPLQSYTNGISGPTLWFLLLRNLEYLSFIYFVREKISWYKQFWNWWDWNVSRVRKSLKFMNQTWSEASSPYNKIKSVTFICPQTFDMESFHVLICRKQQGQKLKKGRMDDALHRGWSSWVVCY